MEANNKLYTTQFWLLCLSNFFFAISFNMMIPELPSYLTAMGGGDKKGWIIGLFTITACISRPFSGKLADTIGRVPVMVIGSMACLVCSVSYPFMTFVSGFMMLRFLHGFSTGFKPTGTSAYVSDIVTPLRRGEAMGVVGMSSNIGMSFAPTIGSYITSVSNMNIMFYSAAFFALLSVVILYGMKETLANPQPFKWKYLKISSNEIFDPKVIPAAIVMLLPYLSFGAMLTLVPDLSEHIGMHNKGLFFSIATFSSLITRFVGGKVSDKYGRIVVLKFSIVLIALAQLIMAFANTPFLLIMGAIVMGLGLGTFSPAIMAWTIDLCDEEHRGKAIATVYIALEIGIGSGAFLSAWMYGNNPNNFYITFLLLATFAILANVFLWVWGKKRIA
mgnify:FL=1